MADPKFPPPPPEWAPETLLVHGGSQRSANGELTEALYLTQSYVYDTAEQAERRFKDEEPGYIYSRFSNPTVAMFEERVRLLEGAEACRATATGMAAVTAAMLCYLKAGDHVVASRALFGSCRYVVEDLCPRFGITTTLIDGRDLAQWQAAMRPNTRVAFFETPANPTLDIVDIRGVADIAHAGGAIVVVDNVFATPMMQRPMQFGADVVVYSATKHMDGQGRCLGGAILCTEQFVKDHLSVFLRQTGPAISPFNAWIMLKSLETMPLRVRAQCASAATIADMLAGQPGVARVLYPFRPDFGQADLARRQMAAGGQIVTFSLSGGKPAAFAFLNALRLAKISNNLGDAKSLITHPATTTHQRLKPEARAELMIDDGMLRLSVGLEAVADIAADLERGLAAARAVG